MLLAVGEGGLPNIRQGNRKMELIGGRGTT